MSHKKGPRSWDHISLEIRTWKVPLAPEKGTFSAFHERWTRNQGGEPRLLFIGANDPRKRPWGPWTYRKHQVEAEKHVLDTFHTLLHFRGLSMQPAVVDGRRPTVWRLWRSYVSHRWRQRKQGVWKRDATITTRALRCNSERTLHSQINSIYVNKHQKADDVIKRLFLPKRTHLLLMPTSTKYIATKVGPTSTLGAKQRFFRWELSSKRAKEMSHCLFSGSFSSPVFSARAKKRLLRVPLSMRKITALVSCKWR